MSDFEIILDNSKQNLTEVPSKILQMHNLKMLYLQQNFIKELPKNFFQELPQLTWLDLRRNHLTAIPKAIAHHPHLENLLLSDNKIEELPNELGLLPKLKVLQVGHNPLSYPNSRIIGEGTKHIVKFLREQYEKAYNPILLDDSEEDLNDKDTKSEEEIRVVDDYENFVGLHDVGSSLTVKSLSKIKKEDSGLIHAITTTSPNRISLKSYYEEDASTVSGQTSAYIPVSLARKSWMDRLKELLDKQEKILQQERNLQALSDWRAEKRAEPVQSTDDVTRTPPYATDPRFNAFLSREDMTQEIDKMIKFSKSQPNKQEIDKLIGDLVSQLKELEVNYGGAQSPQMEMSAAGSQILKIMEMHKKLVKLQETNNLVLQ